MNCPPWITPPKPPPFRLREQIQPFNTKIEPYVLKWQILDGEVHTGSRVHNSPLMISFHAGLIVGDLVAQGVPTRDIEVWIEPA